MRSRLHYIKQWDSRTSNGVDYFIVNSKFIAKRISKVYRRESKVIYPPVDISSFIYTVKKEEYYLKGSRMVPYKKMDLIVETFSDRLEKKLVVIGWVGNALREYMQNAKAFVFAAEEDF